MDEAAARLERDDIIWLTTVDYEGQPQSSPVWFVWDGEAVHIASEPGAGKVGNITANSRVALHLEGAGPNDTVVTIEGRAELAGPLPPSYADKYEDGFERIGTTAADYFATFSVGVRVTPTRWRVFASG